MIRKLREKLNFSRKRSFSCMFVGRGNTKNKLKLIHNTALKVRWRSRSINHCANTAVGYLYERCRSPHYLFVKNYFLFGFFRTRVVAVVTRTVQRRKPIVDALVSRFRRTFFAPRDFQTGGRRPFFSQQARVVVE